VAATARRTRQRKCAICREPGHNKTAHTPMEQQQFRLSGETIRPIKVTPRGGVWKECPECFAVPGAYHAPHCMKAYDG
jgi:hypothetical protein